MNSELTVMDVAETRTETQDCPNCGAALLGEYCQDCGQKKIDRQELSIKRFSVHAANEITDLESSKAFNSLRAVLFEPGRLTDEYLAGRKGRYITPVRLYLTFSALYFLFAWGALYEARAGGIDRMRQAPWAISLSRARGVDVNTLVEKVYQRVEKYAAVLRFASVLVSGIFLTLLYYGTRKYYVEHLIFSLHYYSFDFFSKSVFGLLFVTATLIGWKLPGMVLNFFYPVAFIYLMLALRRVYKQSWGKTVAKSLVLFICETLLFIAVNMSGFFLAIAFV
jgi:hypothetical protein